MSKASAKHTIFDTRSDADGTIVLNLPIMPPSANQLFANRGRQRIKTEAYDSWLRQMGLVIRAQCKTRIVGRADIVIDLEDKHPSRDADNCIKGICDLLVKVGIIADDSAKHVRSVSVTWRNVENVIVSISARAEAGRAA